MHVAAHSSFALQDEAEAIARTYAKIRNPVLHPSVIAEFSVQQRIFESIVLSLHICYEARRIGLQVNPEFLGSSSEWYESDNEALRRWPEFDATYVVYRTV